MARLAEGLFRGSEVFVFIVARNRDAFTPCTLGIIIILIDKGGADVTAL